MRQPTRRHSRGFTLIELIVAMGMVAILSVSLYASLRIAFHAKDSAEKTIEPPRTAELAMEFIRNDLENAMTPNAAIVAAITAGTATTNPPPALAGSFVGTSGKDGRGRDADDLVFYSTAESPLHATGSADIKMIELAVVQPQGSNDYVLVRRVTPNLLASSPPNPDEEVLCRGVAGFNLRYYDGTDWQDSWDSTQQDTQGNVGTIPSAVEVTVQLDRPNSSGQMQTFRYVRIFPLSCSTGL
jgi:general secretion pathway protein J